MKNLKKVLAILGVIILLGAILTICILLVASKNLSDTIVRGLVSCLVALPIIAYGYSILLRYSVRLKNSIQGDANNQDDDKE